MRTFFSAILKYEPVEMRFVQGVFRWLIVPVVLIVLAVVFDFFQNPMAQAIYQSPDSTLFDRLFLPLTIFFILLPLGLLVYRRVPQNLMGVLLIFMGTFALTLLVSYKTPHWLVATQGIFIPLYWQGVGYIPIIFPDGKAPNRWSAWYLTANIVFALIAGVLEVFAKPSLNDGPERIPYVNPYFIADLASFHAGFIVIWSILFLPMVALLFLSPIIRFRHSRPNTAERQQIKWLALVSIILALFLAFYVIVIGILRNLSLETIAFTNAPIIQYVYVLTMVLVPPLILSNAILRHKLYDIDIIIRRTLIYSILSAILLGIYFGTVILVQELFQSATGEVPDFAIVLSTLLIAALFNPLRQHIQAQIDRRFYRRKYDVEQTLAEFQQNLREEVDMPTLQSNLVAVVNETMQPSSIRLWVKGSKS